MSKNFQCLSCQECFSSKQWLDYHLNNKKIPCNFMCKKCGIKCNNQIEFKYHMDLHKTEQKFEKNISEERRKKLQLIRGDDNQKEEIQMLEEKTHPIPIEDFDVQALKDIKVLRCTLLLENNEESEKSLFQNSDSFELTERSTIISTKTQVIRLKRAQDAENAIPLNILQNTLSRAMDFKNFKGGINDHIRTPLTVCAIYALDAVLKQQDLRFQNICLTDVSRGVFKVFRRNVEGICSWERYQKEKILDVIGNYARNIFWFILEASLQKLFPVHYVDDNMDEYALALNGIDESKVFIVYSSPNQNLYTKEVDICKIKKGISNNHALIDKLTKNIKQHQHSLQNLKHPGATFLQEHAIAFQTILKRYFSTRE